MENPSGIVQDSSPEPKEFKNEGPSLHPLTGESKNWIKTISLILSGILIILGGVATGNWLAKKGISGKAGGGKTTVVKTEKTVGSTDTKTFRDSAEGVLEKGGIDGEGTHHLTRPGGPSQTAYLTSSVIDLEPYVGKRVKVWGETFSAQKAGWLMDVGKIELLD